MFMQAQGWTEDMFPVITELSSSLSQDKIAFRHGDVQILVHNGVHPDTDIMRLLEEEEASLIGFSTDATIDLITSTPSLSRLEIDTSIYPSLTDKLSTFGTTMTLVSSADLDDETMRQLITALDENKESFQDLHPALTEFTIDRRPQWFGSIKAHQAISE